MNLPRMNADEMDLKTDRNSDPVFIRVYPRPILFQRNLRAVFYVGTFLLYFPRVN